MNDNNDVARKDLAFAFGGLGLCVLAGTDRDARRLTANPAPARAA